MRETVYSDIGALPSDADAVFLAAHTPMSLSHVKGPELHGAASGERQVHEALMSAVGDPDRNTLVAVTGGSGTGKSHIVRWVHAHLDADDARFHVLYVPRAVQTIRELLRRLVGGLPSDRGEDFLARIDAAVGRATPAELADRLLEEMRLSLTWRLEPRLPARQETVDEAADREERNVLLGEPDEDTRKRRNGLADLMSLPEINRALLRPGGRLGKLVESLFEKTSRRDEQQEQFEPSDLPLRQPGIRRALANNDDLRELWETVHHQPRPALDLLDEALRDALPRTLGIRDQTGETLDSLFRHSRQMLREQGKDMILLFEDLAQFGLVDGELYDQFVTQPGTDLAPLRVLFAVTTNPFDKLLPTVQTRITHRFVVDENAFSDGEQFAARYLNLVRVGRAGAEAARVRARDTVSEAWVPNACDTRSAGLPCQFRDECHSGFGTVEVPGVGEVGLYPYNHNALRRALTPGSTTRTPRSILDTCVTEELVEAEPRIEQGTYPHARVRERVNFHVNRTKDSLLGGQVGDEADRLYRALVIWGDEAPLAPAIIEAFSLPTSSTPQAAASPQRHAPRPADRPAEPTVPQQPSPLESLYQWTAGARMPADDADYYRATLHRLVSGRLDLEQELFHTADGKGSVILGALFNSTSFDLGDDTRGRTAGTQNVRFQVRRDDPEDQRLLIAARWFSDHGHWNKSAGTWPWPDGYTPVELMLVLETRLESWTEAVRHAYRDRVRGRDLASAAVGLQAIALMATGADPLLLQQAKDVLRLSTASVGRPNPAWFDADRAARAALPRISATVWVGQFAAVRQGEGGRPQLIDSVDLDAGLIEVCKSPTAFLGRVADGLKTDAPELAECARDLLAVFNAAATGSLHEVSDASAALQEGLAGQTPGDVAAAAGQVGKLAKDENVYRSAVTWPDFRDALEALTNTPSSLPLDWRFVGEQGSVDEALATQHWGRHAVAGGLALERLRRALAETVRDCARQGSAADGLGERKARLATRLQSLESRLRKLSVEEAGHVER